MKDDEGVFFKSVFDNMIDIVLGISKEGNIMYGNKAARDFYGYTEAELMNLHIYDIRKKREDKNCQKLLAELKEGMEYESFHRNKNGKFTPVKVRSVFVEGIDNEYIISIVHDMSKMQVLAEKAKMFDVSLNLSEEGIIVFDINFRVRVWNKAAERLFGYTEDEMLGKTNATLVKDDRRKEMDVVADLLRIGQVIDRLETVRIHKAGHLVELSVVYSPIFDQYSNITGFMGVYNDITEMKTLNTKVEEFRERTAMALDGGKFCIWDINLLNRKMTLHNNMESLFGYNDDELGNDYNKWVTYMHPDDMKLTESIVRQYLTEGKEFIVEYRMLTKAGEYKWVRTKGKTIEYDDQGNPTRLLGTTEDIEEHKRYENALVEKNKELEQMIFEAGKANRAKSQFLANMSHEIRTPLNGVISAIQLLKKMEGYTDEQKNLLDILEFSSNTLKGIVSNILDISKAEQDKIEVKRITFSLKTMMQSLYNELQLSANTKGIEAGYLFDPKIDYDVISDPQIIQQILNNLISNALKFTESGYISIKTRLVEENESSALIEFEVKDSGIGINKEDIEKIFQAFMQVDVSDNKKFDGTGLGLAICRQYAEALGGEVRCNSNKNEGSSFVFACPFEKSPEKEKRNKAKILKKIALQEPFVKHNEKTILSVDDNAVNQKLVEYIIERMGFQFRAAYHADDTMKVLKENSIDLILMDIQLPDTNGYKLTEIIRSNEEFEKIPIIAMTAYSQTEDKNKCIAAGMNDFIVKPIDVDHLEFMIKNRLSM